jgi:CTP synthase
MGSKQQQKSRMKYIFVTGGVVSSLGKGIVAGSVAALLEARGLKVSLTKADPYLNVDPGTMNPFQHGEVFVTDDGAETDLDLGHYERFSQAVVSRENSFSSGQVYDAVISRERRGDYLGGTVQVIPHVTDQIKHFFVRGAAEADIAIIEIGGTVGDIEGQPFIEAMRQMSFDVGEENVLFLHLTLVPYIRAAQELKTKPTQHSVKELRVLGIQPHILCLRAERPVPAEQKQKISLQCNVRIDSVIDVVDMDSIYKIPLALHEQGLDQVIVERLNIWTGAPDLSMWKRISHNLDHPERVVKIGLVGKYVDVVDAYKSIHEALVHAGIHHRTKVLPIYIDSVEIRAENVAHKLKGLSAVIIPGGFGNRGIEGKIAAIRYVREQKIPFLGICLGMQLAAVEFARNVLGISEATSSEFGSEARNKIIDLMPEQVSMEKKGGTMRLGAYPCVLKPKSLAANAYKASQISERHRHRFEFNNDYRSVFEERGVVFSGLSPDQSLVEIMEVIDHPWFVGCQFHPELKSSPIKPHPLFCGLVEAALAMGGTRDVA